MALRSLKKRISTINNALKRHPVLFGLSLAALEGIIADSFTQRILEQKKTFSEFQWDRLKTFGIFNIYVGSMDYFFINKLMPKIFGIRQGLKIMIGKLLIYEVTLAPIYYFPVFYYVQQSIHDNDFSFISFERGLNHFAQNYKSDILSMWGVWIPASAIVFGGVIPKHLILPFFSAVDICWLIGVSLYRGDINKYNSTEHTHLEKT